MKRGLCFLRQKSWHAQKKKRESSHNKGILNAHIISQRQPDYANIWIYNSFHLNLKTPAPAQNDGQWEFEVFFFFLMEKGFHLQSNLGQ